MRANASFLLAASLALSLAGCGEDNPATPTKSAAPTQPAEPGPVATALRKKADESAAMIPPEVMALFKKAGEELAASDLIEKATHVGSAAPDFQLSDADGMPVSLKSLRDQGPVVVAFYRGKW